MSSLRQRGLLVAWLGLLTFSFSSTADAAVLADSAAEFSGIQGQDNWYYGYYDRTADADGTYQQDDFSQFSTTGPFPGFGFNGSWDYLDAAGTGTVNPPWTAITATGGHPNGTNNGNEHWAVRRWEAEQDGHVQINYDLDVGAGWTNTQLYLNGELKHVRTIPGVQPRMQESIALLNVKAGDVLDFVIDPNGPDGSDTTVLQVTIDDQITTGTLIDGIVHANSIVDFSFGGVQGEKGWTNGYYNVTADTGNVSPDDDGTYQAGDFIPFPDDYYTGTAWDWPAGNPPWDLLGSAEAHPNGTNQAEEHWVIRRWESDVDETVQIDWNISKQNAGCGNGITGKVFVNGEEVDSATIAFNDTIGVSRSVLVDLRPGDLVDIVETPWGTDGTGADGCDGCSYGGGIRTALTIDTLTWDELGDGNWGAIDGGTGNSNWLSAGAAGSLIPDAENPAHAIIDSNIVTVADDREAISLSVSGGGIEIAAGRTLSVLTQATFAEGTSLDLADGATFSANGGGAIGSLTIAGTSTISTLGDMPVAGLSDGGVAAAFVKQGGGTMAIEAVTAEAGTSFQINGGTLAVGGANPLGGSTAPILLGGGTLLISGERDMTPDPGLSVTDGLAAHFDAGAITGLADGDQVDTWIDSSPAGGHDATLNRGVPTYVESIDELNGLPAVRFGDAGNTALRFTEVTDSRTMFAVMRDSDTNTDFRFLMGRAADNPDFHAGNNGVIFGTWALDAVEFGTTRLNGQVIDASAEKWPTEYSVMSFEATDVFSVGQIGNDRDYNNRGWRGDIAEILIYNTPMDAAALDDVAYHLQQKYDVGPRAAIVRPDTDFIVSADSAIDAVTDTSATFGNLTMHSGVLATSGAVEGISFAATTIDAAATAIGFDPQVATDYGPIEGNGAAVVISKVGSGSLTLQEANTGLSNATFQAAGGTLTMANSQAWGGSTKMQLADGVFEVVAGVVEGVAPEGAVAEWKFEEGTGLTTADTSAAGGNYSGTLAAGVEWATDPDRGTVLKFDSWDDFVDAPDFNLTTDTITFTAWINGHKNANWTGIVMSRGTQATGIGYGANDTLHYTWNNNSPATYNWVAGAPVIPDDKWALVAMVIEPGKATAYVSVDGGLASGENAIAHISQTVDAVQIGRDNCCGTNRFLVGMMDDVRIYDRALTAEEFAAMAGAADLDMTTHSVEVTGDAELRASAFSTSFGPLTMTNGTLTVTGSPAGVSFNRFLPEDAADTTIAAGATAVGFDPQTPTDIGTLDGSGAAVSITKAGTSDLLLDEANIGLDSATFVAQGGRLIGQATAAGDNPFGGAILQTGGGEFVLAGPATDAAATFDNALDGAANGTVTAGSGGNGTSGVAVTFGSAANGVTVPAGNKVTLRSIDGYTLNVAGAIGGAGQLGVSEGDVLLAAGGTASSIGVTGGTLSLGSAVSADAVEISGGTIDAGSDLMTVNEYLKIGDFTLRIDQGNTFLVGGSDVVAGADITVRGGELNVGGPTSPGKVISVNFTTTRSDGPHDVERTAGVVDAANWNNMAPEAAGGPETLMDSDAAATTAELTWNAGPPWDTSAAINDGDADDNDRMMKGYLDYGGSGDGVTIAVDVEGIPYETYDLYVYHDSSTNDRAMSVSLDGGATKFAYTKEFPGAFNGTFVLDQHDTLDEAVAGGGGNYMLFDGMRDSTLNLVTEGEPPVVGVLRSPVQGIQIVEKLTTALQMPNANFHVVADSTIKTVSDGDAIFGNLSIDAGVVLSVEGAPISIADVNAGDGSSIEATLLLRGALSVADGVVGTFNILGELEVEEEGAYVASVSGGAADLMVIEEDAFLGGTLTLQGVGAAGAAVGDHHLTILETAGGEGEVVDEFAVAPEVGSHIGAGLFATDPDEDGSVVTYTDGSVEVDVFQAIAGDTNGDRQVDNADLQQILGAGSFGNPGDWDWGQGDFNADGAVNNGDLQLILATGQFGAGPYAAMAAEAGVVVVPEPGTLWVLLSGALGLLLWRRRRAA